MVPDGFEGTLAARCSGHSATRVPVTSTLLDSDALGGYRPLMASSDAADRTLEPGGAAMAVQSADGARIAYELHGDGPGVILIDGAMCFRDSGPMRALCAQLDDDFTVLLYDRRGRGTSTDTERYHVDRELDDLDALLDALLDSTGTGCSAPALVGVSSGGALALRAAARMADRIRAVVVFEPPYVPEPLAEGAHEYTDALTRALLSGDRDEAVTLFLGRVGMPAKAIAGIRRSPEWAAMTAIAPTLAYDDAAMGDGRVPADLVASVSAPVLALAGDAGPDLMRFGAREVAECARNGEFDVLDGQTHDVDAGVLAARIREFLRP